jgi:uncharacterized membrane protein YkoI
MMKDLLKIFAVVILIAGTISCSDDNDIDKAKEEAIKKASKSFDGIAVETIREKDDGVWVIKVWMLNSKEASVLFEYLEDDISLIKVSGKKKPFDYNVIHDNGLIDFLQAKEAAVNEVGNSMENDNIDEWSLEEDDDFNHKWVYDFEFNIPDKDVYIDAKNGDVLGTDS